MSAQWYFAINDQEKGPVTAQDLKKLADAGKLTTKDLVWKEGLPNWIPAGQVKGLFGANQLAKAPSKPVEEEDEIEEVDDEEEDEEFEVVEPVRKKKKFYGYAGFWKRFCALFVDGMCLGIPMSIIMRATGVNNPENLKKGLDGLLLFEAIYGLILWLYFALMESSSYQGTLGKRAVGIKVTDMKGNRISFAQATGRHFARIPSSFFFIGYLMAAFTEKKQALHDIIAGCLVVKSQE
ncbi:RDD family protein [Telmatocola sphagniphila]|uniref:RDD family protein n=1 Tax=Telmatocola sphagniphila TaxID=1123043 RepID=A0A8E6B651_9BACT|nr:RDD family protein [Telmatocola sphagniphila]QVL32578.1 RDD family protein [Telmatocola sphagniphila]